MRDRRGLFCASELSNCSVESCRSSERVRATPICTPCVKTLCPLSAPYPPSGANVTELPLGISRQFDGTLTRKRLPSLYSTYLVDGSSAFPTGYSSGWFRPFLAFRVTSAVVGARGSSFR